jgi:DNA-binding winged helix-turn-helix (wHTH) protein/TolB-like protein/Flp pilus assembly protein TadD
MALKTKQIYEFGAFRLDAAERLLFQDGEAVPLPPKVIETLLALVESNGRLIEKEDLIRRVWPDTFVEENNLNKNVSALRKALGEGQGELKFIETVPKRGYRFVAKVNVVQDGSGPEFIIERSKVRVRVEEEQETDEPESEAKSRRPALETQHVALIAGKSSTQPLWHRYRFITFAAIIALALATAVGAWLILRNANKSSGNPNARAGESVPLKTIAVLPFQPISADSRDEILELGMADALITKLSALEHVIVRPTSAVRKYAGLNQDPLAAGREQKVEAVLVGNVQKVADVLRVTVQLLNVEDGRSLWSEKFDVKSADIFAVQDTISDKVTSALAPQITGEERARLNKRYTEDDEAYELYQKGRFFLDKRDDESIRKALGFFQQATEKDPNYALAFAGITQCYIGFASSTSRTSKEDIAQAKAAAARAITLDDTLAEAHHALGEILLDYDWDWQGAEREFQRALQLNPNNAAAHMSYGFYLLTIGRREEALTEARRAVELDPLSSQINSNLAIILMVARQGDEALAQLRETLKLHSDYAYVQSQMGRAYLVKGMYDEAIAHYQKVIDAGGDRNLALVGLAQAYAHTGRRDEALQILEELKAQLKDGHVKHYYLAVAEAALDERDAAFESLDRAMAEHDLGMLYLKVDPRFDQLRSDPRFTDLIRRVGIPQ